jgi:uncharacterized protein (TIGR04141 family)
VHLLGGNVDAKRTNPSLWKIAVPDEQTPAETVSEVVDRYGALSKMQPTKYPPLTQVEIRQPATAGLQLYTRKRRSLGLGPFLADYLADAERRNLGFRTVDGCLFITTETSLFAVTSGPAHRIFEEYVDYSFPFEVAKRLVANNFTEEGIREISGIRAGRSDIYRRPQSISNSDSFGKVWKRLVGKLNTGLLPPGSFLATIIDPAKPPTLEMKSSFTVRKKLDLKEVIALVQELEGLPEPTAEQLKALSFLDNLYVVRGRDLIEQLRHQLIEDLRQFVVTGSAQHDLEIGDPDDLAAFQAGTDYRLSRVEVDGSPPTIEDLVPALKQQCAEVLDNAEEFCRRVESMYFRYQQDPEDASSEVRKELHKFLHGQVDLDGHAYFLLDKSWYRVQGKYLQNLKKDFINEVFEAPNPILLSADLGFIEWNHKDEDAFNRAQSGEDGFYYGDKIFARTDRGLVELFDLLRVDEEAKTLHIVHVKDSFNAKMRDACSQISISRDVVENDLKTDGSVLSSYFDEWCDKGGNTAGVERSRFLTWFDFRRTYLVLASTPTDFSVADVGNSLRSHIARREILVTRNEFAAAGTSFRLAHTRRS